MIEQEHVNVNPETSDEMDSTPSSVADGNSPPLSTVKQSKDLIIGTILMLNRSDTKLSEALKEIIDSIERMVEHATPVPCPGPSKNIDQLRGGIVDMYNLAKDTNSSSRDNFRLLAGRLHGPQVIRNESITGVALQDDVRALRDDLSKLTKTVTTDLNSVSPSLKDDFKALRDAVTESVWLNHRDAENLKLHISALMGQCSKDEDKKPAILHLLADDLDTFRYELAMLRRDITSVRVPGAWEDISISKDVEALHMNVSTLEQRYGKKTWGCHDIIAPKLTDIPRLRDRIRVLRGVTSSIHVSLLRNEKNMRQRAPELHTSMVLKSKIQSTQILLKILRDRIDAGPSLPLHYAFLEHDAVMAEREDLVLRKEIAWRCNKENPENKAYKDCLPGLFDYYDPLKAKIPDLFEKDFKFKEKVAACLWKETNDPSPAVQDQVDPANDRENLSSADSETFGLEQVPSVSELAEPEQTTAGSNASEVDQYTLKRYLLEHDRFLNTRADAAK